MSSVSPRPPAGEGFTEAIGQAFAVGLVLSLSIGMLDVAMGVLTAPARYPTFSSLLLPVSADVVLVFAAYSVLWLVLTLPVQRIFRLPALASAVVPAFFIGGLSIQAALLFPISLSPFPAFALKALLVLLICLGVSIGAYFATEALARAPRAARKAAALALAMPFGLAAALAALWLQTIWKDGGVSLFSVSLAAGLLAVVCMAIYLSYRWHDKRRPAALVTLLAVVIVVSPAFAGLLGQDASRPSELGTTGSRSLEHVILITVDTLRVDALSCYNAGAPATPHIDRLANHAMLFERAYSPGPWTLPALYSVMTGLPSTVHRTTGPESVLNGSFRTLAEVMRGAGYYTAAIGSNPVIRPQSNLSQGFVEYDFYPKPTADRTLADYALARLLPRWCHPEADAQKLTDLAIDWLEANHSRDFLLWLHYSDPHLPYAPPREFLPSARPPPGVGTSLRSFRSIRAGTRMYSRAERKWIRELYQGEVRYVDENVGRLLGTLRSLGLYDDALIILSSDHGEEFWEHGSFEHGHALYDELLRVPLMIKHPRSARRERIDTPVSIRSIMPTILELCRIDYPGEALYAQSLTAVWPSSPDRPPTSPIISTGMLYYEEQESVLFEQYKYIHSPVTDREELYDLDRDPRELSSIVADAPDKLKQAREILAEHHLVAAESAALHGAGGVEELDAETARRLKALGYID